MNFNGGGGWVSDVPNPVVSGDLTVTGDIIGQQDLKITANSSVGGNSSVTGDQKTTGKTTTGTLSVLNQPLTTTAINPDTCLAGANTPLTFGALTEKGAAIVAIKPGSSNTIIQAVPDQTGDFLLTFNGTYSGTAGSTFECTLQVFQDLAVIIDRVDYITTGGYQTISQTVPITFAGGDQIQATISVDRLTGAATDVGMVSDWSIYKLG